MKKIFFAMLLSVTIFYCDAQQEQKRKVFDHYFGIQANQLFKQFLNLDASNTIVKTPYLLSYSVFYTKFHLALTAGFGYSYKKTKDQLSPSDLQSKINDVNYRFGITRNFVLGKRWESSTGINYTANYNLDRTFTFSVLKSNGGINIDSTSTISTSLIRSRGAELQLCLGIHLNDHIMIFTEASLDYNIIRNKNNVLITETKTDILFPENDTYVLSASNSDIENSTFEITLPLALFVTIKF